MERYMTDSCTAFILKRKNYHEAAQATCFYCVGLFGNPDETQCTSLRNSFSVMPQE